MAADVKVDALDRGSGALSGLRSATDGVALVDGSRVLAIQTDTTKSDIYIVSASGAWARDTATALSRGMDIQVDNPASDSDLSRWTLTTTAPYTRDGLSPLHFEVVTRLPYRVAGEGLEETPLGELRLPGQGVAGTYANPITILNDQGITIDVREGAEAQTAAYSGLDVSYLTQRGVRVGPGSIYVPDIGLLGFDATTNITGLNLTAGTWYYLYAYISDGLPTLQYSTTVPDAPYRGAARLMTGDATKRYVPRSAIYAAALNNMRRFQTMPGGLVRWIADQNTTLRVVSGATNTTAVAQDISAFCPPMATGVYVAGFVNNTDNLSVLYVSADGDGLQTIGVNSATGQLASAATVASSASRQRLSGPIALFGTRTLHHHQSNVGASRSHNIDLLGYYEAA